MRVVRRSDGYYVQLVLDVERTEERQPTQRTIGLDVGLNHFYTDSDGHTVENPRHLRKSEKRLKRMQRRASKKVKGSKNRRKAVKRLGKAHLKGPQHSDVPKAWMRRLKGVPGSCSCNGRPPPVRPRLAVRLPSFGSDLRLGLNH